MLMLFFTEITRVLESGVYPDLFDQQDQEYLAVAGGLIVTVIFHAILLLDSKLYSSQGSIIS